MHRGATICETGRGRAGASRAAIILALAAVLVAACDPVAQPGMGDAAVGHGADEVTHAALGFDMEQCAGTHHGDLHLAGPRDVEKARLYTTVEGDLLLTAGDRPLRIDAGGLPCLRRVTGALRIGLEMVTEAGDIELTALQQVEGHVVVGFVVDAPYATASVRLPQLHTIGREDRPDGLGLQVGESLLVGGVHAPLLKTVYGPVYIGYAVISLLDLSSLETVTSNLSIGPAAEMVRLGLGELRTVGGELRVELLPQIPFSQIDGALGRVAAASINVRGIGCDRADADASPDCS